MSEQEFIGEAEFFRHLGIDPDHVKGGSLQVGMRGNLVEMSYTAVYVVPPHLIGMAFMAATPATEPPEPKQPEDRKPPAKKTAKKPTPRKKS